MNRTNSFREFLSDNRRLLLFLALLLLGVLGGSLAFTVSHTLFSADLTVMLQVSPIEGAYKARFRTVLVLFFLLLSPGPPVSDRPFRLRCASECPGPGVFRIGAGHDRGVLLRLRGWRGGVCSFAGTAAQPGHGRRATHGAARRACACPCSLPGSSSQTPPTAAASGRIFVCTVCAFYCSWA